MGYLAAIRALSATGGLLYLRQKQLHTGNCATPLGAPDTGRLRQEAAVLLCTEPKGHLRHGHLPGCLASIK